MSGIHTTPTTPVDIYLIHLALVLASGSATRTRSGPRRRVGAVFPLALVFRRSTGLDYFILYDGMIFIPARQARAFRVIDNRTRMSCTLGEKPSR